MSLVNGLSILNPSRQCREAIMPFLCLFFFSLCDSSNHLHTILKEDCIELRDDICAEEWSQAVGFLGAGVLPACERLADVSDECLGRLVLATVTNRGGYHNAMVLHVVYGAILVHTPHCMPLPDSLSVS